MTDSRRLHGGTATPYPCSRCGDPASVITPDVAPTAGRFLCGACALQDAEFWMGAMATWSEFVELTEA